MGQYVADTRTIASVYPLPTTPVERPFGETNRGGWTMYRLDACHKGDKPTQLVVADSWQAVIQPLTRKHDRPHPVFAENIAKDVIREWTAPKLLGAPPGSGPGIWLCAGDTPTDEEIQAALAKQTSYFEWLFYEGQRLHHEQAWKQITEEHRVAAKWLGKDEPWIKLMIHTDIVKCPACATVVDPKAYLCANCKFPVRPMPEEMVEQLREAQRLMAPPARAGR